MRGRSLGVLGSFVSLGSIAGPGIVELSSKDILGIIFF